jgi:hypothetical protein
MKGGNRGEDRQTVFIVYLEAVVRLAKVAALD